MKVKIPFLLMLVLSAMPALAQTGKIAGVVTDPAGGPLPGVNVVIEGTTQGATTDASGYYVILNVSPGTYALRASFVGFTPQVVQDVNVDIDLTSEVDFTLQEETVGLDEVIVAATRPVVQRDISANVANLSAGEIENIPVAGVTEVINLQAGIEPGMSIRGGGLNEVSFQVDGMSMRDARSNVPFTGISYTSVDEVQVQTGGFNAEYGNVRSGLINVVTKEGARDRYSADVIVRYAPPQAKNFGGLPGDPDSYLMRSYLDPDVAFTGTHSDGSVWDTYTRNQYPKFEGWNSVAEKLNSDDDPTNDLTPTEAQELFKWFHRKEFEIQEPDYEVDASVGGPMPFVSRLLGALRFFGSYRQTQRAYIVPQMRPSYKDRTGQMKLTSDVAKGMKLQLQGMYSKQYGINTNRIGNPIMFQGELPKYPWDTRGSLMANSLTGAEQVGHDVVFANDNWSQMDVIRNTISATFTHTLSARTFYKVQLQRNGSDYFTRPGPRRDSTIIHQIGGWQLDAAPFGFMNVPLYTPTGLRLGSQWATARDTSNVALWTGRFDLTSQVNRYMQLKTGLEFSYTDYDMNFGAWNPEFPNQANPKYVWQRQSTQGAAYAQTKLEFQGLVANVGLRLDYFNPGGNWYDYERFERAFSPKIGFDNLDETLEQQPTERQLRFSPRLGVSHPITENSKLYFNFGIFRQVLDPMNLFAVEAINTGAVDWIGNPNHPMPATTAYELGYEHNLFDVFLLRLTGYYKDVSQQPRGVRYQSLDGQVSYVVMEPLNYEDIRGFEISLYKNVGQWVRGFVNYTYMAAKRGNFGFGRQYENRVEQRQYERESRAHYQNKPVPEPFARFNIELLTPQDFGPEVLGGTLLADWHLNLLGEWRSGDSFTWSGGGGDVAGLENNVKWRDFYNLDLRLSKNFTVQDRRVGVFMDVSNVLNLRHVYRGSAFIGEGDFRDYMMSLQLPEDAFEELGQDPYAFIPGDDRPGVFRKPGVAFVPIEIVRDITSVTDPRSRPLYFEQQEGANGTYYQWVDGEFRQADKAFVEQILDKKAYIDMPNATYHTFLNPRTVRFGLRVSL